MRDELLREALSALDSVLVTGLNNGGGAAGGWQQQRRAAKCESKVANVRAKIDAYLNRTAAPSPESSGAAGMMPEPVVPLAMTITWPQEELDKGESVWGAGDIDRGFQNMGMEINRLRALSRSPDSVRVPREPPVELLISMALRLNHGFGLCDSRSQEVQIADMRKAYEEVVGDGFYSDGVKGRYSALLHAASGRG